MSQADTALKLLEEAGISTEKTRQAVIERENSYLDLARTLDFLRQSEILTKKNFKTLLAPQQSCLITGDNRSFWYAIPTEFKNENTWNKILTLCVQKKSLAQIKQSLYELVCDKVVNSALHQNSFLVKQESERLEPIEFQEITDTVQLVVS